MIFTETHILSDKELKRLKDHQYSSSCCSLLDPLMQKYWNWFVTLVPLWIAPNLITMVGLMVNIVTTLVLVFHLLRRPRALHLPDPGRHRREAGAAHQDQQS